MLPWLVAHDLPQMRDATHGEAWPADTRICLFYQPSFLNLSFRDSFRAFSSSFLQNLTKDPQNWVALGSLQKSTNLRHTRSTQKATDRTSRKGNARRSHSHSLLSEAAVTAVWHVLYILQRLASCAEQLAAGHKVRGLHTTLTKVASASTCDS